MKIKLALQFLFISVSLNGLIAQTQINQQDSIALAALYNATNGDNWKDNTNWLTDKSVGVWFGVSVNIDGRVTSIDLSDNSLNGSIPPEIGNLSELQSLNLSANYLIGSIPPEIGNLTNLKSLRLNSNYIDGYIPVEIGNLTNLHTIFLSSNLLSGQVPPEIWNLTNMVYLSFGNNQISGQIPSEIGNLRQLKYLILSNNLFEGDFPPELLLLSNLEYISIGSNKFTSFPDVSSFINLAYLYINDNALTFDDILPLVDFTGTFNYRDQQKTDQVEYHTLADGDTLVLTTSVKNSGNIYKWYKDFFLIGNDTTYTINSFSAAQAGTYYCIIENPLAVFLSSEVPLQTKNIYVSSLPFYATQFTVTGEEGPLRFATITINGSSYETDENGIATAKLTDGSYDYTLSAYGMQDSNGTVVVNAAAQNIDIAMQPELYTLNLTITDGTKVVPNALVNIDGTDYTASQTGNLSISLLMGNHSYNVSATHFIGDSGTFFQVIPTLDKQIVLTPYHHVEFTVSDGINALQNATVTINDETKMTNAEGKAEFWLLDGSYNYVITAATFGNEGGQLLVDGAAESVPITLSEGYEITFTVSVNNTPASGASIEIDGYTYPCNESGEKSILLSNGTYTYNVLVGSAINKTGEVVVNSAVQTVNNDIPVFAIAEAKKTATNATLSRQTYYDTDNDGILEMFKWGYVSSWALSIDRYGDFQLSNERESLFEVPKGRYQIFEIINVNNDGNPDFYVQDTSYWSWAQTYGSKPDGGYKQILNNSDKRPNMDIDLDGMPDWIEKDGNQLAFGQQDYTHNYINKSFTLKQLDDYVNNYDYSAWNEPKVTKGFSISGLSAFSAIGFTNPPANTSKQMLLDYNQDGLPDIIDEKGVLFRNLGDDTFLEVPFYGKVIPKDLNGDFITDFIATKKDSVIALIYEGNGKYVKQNLITSMAVDDVIYTFDFDKDNDIDVLLPFSFDRNKTATFFVFFENDGNGNFTKHEKLFMEQWKILQCVDINHDGYYDFLMDSVKLVNYEYQKANETFMLMGKAGFEFDVFDNDDKVGDCLFDFDNDGFYEGITTDTVYHFGGIAPNTPPDKPAKPEFYIDKSTGELHVNWNTVNDAESSTCDLTYALRVGTATDKGDILYAHANANGTRRIKQDGNMGGNLSYTLNVKNWKAGDYYISLQAVDPMHSGSEWSDYTIFNNDLLYADFELSEETIAPNDTLTVRFTGSHSDNYIYNWNFGTATVVENTDNQLVKLIFNSAGQHEISLTIENANGQTSEVYKQSVFVNLLNFKVEKYNYVAAADYDADGDINLVTTDGLYKNDGNANFTKLATIFNLTFAPKYALWEDFDKDGDPDLLYSINDAADGQSGILINNGNDDFTETAKTFPAGFFRNLKADIDRDGTIDYFAYDKYFINNGDYTFTEKILLNNSMPYGHRNITDLNNDNFVDVWGVEKFGGAVKFFINQKDGTFNEVTITLPDEFNNNTPILAIQDFNNDNLPDILVKKNDQAFHIFVNQGNNTYDYGKDIIFDFEPNVNIECADFDNNGFTDFAFGTYYNSSLDEAKAIIVLLDKDLKIKSRIETNYHTYFNRGVKMVDLNGDNMADALHYVHTSSYQSLERLMLREGFTPNTAPTAPQDLIAYQTESGIVIRWKSGSDAETPQQKLQYNLSIKDINSGEFLFSPAVSNSENVPPLITRYYIQGNSMTLNSQLIPTGEYEIRLQTIDAWHANSPFSEAITLNVTIEPAFTIPEFACAGSEVNIEYTGNSDANTTYSWDFDGATIVSGTNAGPYSVKWDAGGLKNIKVDVTSDGNTESLISGIRISQIYTDSIIAPDEMVAGIVDTITLPAIPENSSDLIWTIPDGEVEQDNFGETARLIFNSAGEKTIQVDWSENGCPAASLSKTITVYPALPIPTIDVITADQNSKGNSIYWTNNFDSYIEKVLIYKEGSMLNDFEEIAALDASTANQFNDTLANINQRSYRYSMAIKDKWGNISEMGPSHQTVHLRINKALNGWNLFWNSYYGMPVGAYRVYRGTSPDNMILLEQLPASSLSYTDENPPVGELFYSLEIVKQTITTNTFQTKRSPIVINSTTNYVSTQEAFDLIYIDSINLFTMDQRTTIYGPDDNLSILADIYPANATLKSLTWEITSGNELATIDQNGIVKAIEGQAGTIVISATSKDGSTASGSITLQTSSPPQISQDDVSINPSIPTVSDAVNVSAIITDQDGAIESVILNWGLSSDNLDHQSTMQKGTGDVFSTSTAIPAQSSGSTVFCQITATDDDNLSTTTSIFYYEVNSQQELLTPPYAFGFENNSFGLISIEDMAGAQTWTTVDFGTPAPSAKMSGYDGTANVANEDWLILPGFNFSGVSDAVLQFDEAINFANDVSNMKVLISTNYSGTGNPNDAAWTILNVSNRAAGNSYEFVTVSPIDLSSWYGQEKVYIAFLYTSSTNNAATWEIDNLSIDAAEESNELPQISNISINPSDATENDAVNINATITDSDGTIESVILSWGLSSGNLSNKITMQKGLGNVFITISAIPEQSGASTVYYMITATDDDSESVSSPVRTYSISKINELPQISNISINPSEPTENDAVNINATVTDSDGTIESVILSWGLSTGNLSNQITMGKGSSNVYTTNSTIPNQSGESTVHYMITATDNDSESVSSSEMSYSIITDINNSILIGRVQLYPIPVSDKLTIEIEGNNEEIEIDIMDENGKIVFKGELVDKTIVNTSNFSPGAYFIKLKNGNTFGYKKIIIF